MSWSDRKLSEAGSSSSLRQRVCKGMHRLWQEKRKTCSRRKSSPHVRQNTVLSSSVSFANSEKLPPSGSSGEPDLLLPALHTVCNSFSKYLCVKHQQTEGQNSVASFGKNEEEKEEGEQFRILSDEEEEKEEEEGDIIPEANVRFFQRVLNSGGGDSKSGCASTIRAP
ncbi:MAG: hypothetical protein NXY57DRAFT_960678 [Lentinula lateritia]|nr:MAG: hypothetical protein NXY57DRAFT_960678 [Lentinula lateritia]